MEQKVHFGITASLIGALVAVSPTHGQAVSIQLKSPTLSIAMELLVHANNQSESDPFADQLLASNQLRDSSFRRTRSEQ